MGAGHRRLCSLQIDDVVGRAGSAGAGLETCGLLIRLAGNGCRELPWERPDFNPFRLPFDRMAGCHDKTCARCDSPFWRCAIDLKTTRISRRMDRHDRDCPDPALRHFPAALVWLAKHRRRSAPPHEPSAGLDESRRVLGSTLEHRIPGLDVGFSFAPSRPGSDRVSACSPDSYSAARCTI